MKPRLKKELEPCCASLGLDIINVALRALLGAPDEGTGSNGHCNTTV